MKQCCLDSAPRKNARRGAPPAVYELAYAHNVTLMEVLISSVVRKLIVSDEALLMSLAACYQKLRGITVTLKEIAEQPQLVESIALGSWPT